MKTWFQQHVSLVVIAFATVLLCVSGIYELDLHKQANHFKLTMISSDCMVYLSTCEGSVIADISGSDMRGTHNFRLRKLENLGASGPHGPLSYAWVPTSSTLYNDQGATERANECGISMQFSDGSNEELVGIGSINEDGFGPIQRFDPVHLEKNQAYELMDPSHYEGTWCVFRTTSTGRLLFGVAVYGSID